MTFDELLDAASAEALACKMEPTVESTWRKIARTYSERFCTPLDQTLKLDPHMVALHVFESNLESYDNDEHLENLLDMIYTLSDPDYAAQKEVELEEFIKESRRQEAERIKAGRPIHPSMAKSGAGQKLSSEKGRKEESSL